MIGTGSDGRLSLIGISYVILFDCLGSMFQTFLSSTESIRRSEPSQDDDDERDGQSYYEDDPMDRVWSMVSSDQSNSQIRFPFGRSRISCLTYFCQSIYLMFSGIYILKESIENILLSSEKSHSGSHHGHSHFNPSDSNQNDETLIKLMSLSIVLTLLLSKFYNNHSRLSTLIFRDLSLNPFNLFTLSIQSFSLASLVLSRSKKDFQSLDRFLTFVELIAIFKLSVPSLKVLSKTLLQTLPDDDDGDVGLRGLFERRKTLVLKRVGHLI
ncbi:hypothetical protein BY996DRAFT_2547030 [Phakopsora pachyrhizi]|nr:hypothetical protein BY996DRAFT_2547030 [Phakopsora pachyrhizi]